MAETAVKPWYDPNPHPNPSPSPSPNPSPDPKPKAESMARDPEGKYRAESAIIAELINVPKLLDARFDAVQVTRWPNP